ncbi:hypothetical protein [Caloranaerobacter azorensis]|uniref:Vesicle transport v-SNARE N-terminal domain-containing protein n=1 Tax=Caloranaerobacter azorensis TaxID=116090 RepID=A0A6P1YI04_9FIRM|nr:hypothetical protein [Caloranaerobacter azorensis]QIB27506.1 hypothetical protein G3A45_09510 [Caloranaerobacter azorensis]
MENELLLAIKNVLKEELKPIKSDISSIKSILDEHTRILNEHMKKLDEHTQILRALEHSVQVNKAEHDSIMNDISDIKEEIQNLKKDINKVEIITASNWADIAKLKSVK